MADEEDLKINQTTSTTQYVSQLNANDISDEDEIVFRPRPSPAIAPMQLDKYQVNHSVPLKRRFFSTGAKRTQVDDVVEDSRQKYNAMVFASVKDQNPPDDIQRPKPSNLYVTQSQNSATATSKGTQQLITDMSSSVALDNSQKNTMKKLLRRKPQSGVARDRNYGEPEDIQSQFKQQFQQFQNNQQLKTPQNLYDNLLNQISKDEDEDAIDIKVSQKLSNNSTELTNSTITKSKILSRKKEPLSAQLRTQPSNSLNSSSNLESTFKYKELNTNGTYTKVDFSQAIVQQTQQQFKNQFKQAESSKPPIPIVRKAQQIYDPTNKVYNDQILAEVFANLEQKLDWAIRDARLKEIVQICRTQPNLLLEKADMSDFFTHALKLLIDLRSALVTQTFETLLTLYQTYANLDFLAKHQVFLVQLLKKAGNPSLPDFMVLQADQALIVGIASLITSLNYSSCSIGLFLQQLQAEMKIASAPGVKFRALYMLADLLLIAYSSSQSTQIQQLSVDTLSRYGLEWSPQGINYPLGQYVIENSIGQQLIQQKMIKQLSSQHAFINEVIRKMNTDANPEIRKAIRRLYCVCKLLGVCSELYPKMDALIQKEGVADTWWGR